MTKLEIRPVFHVRDVRPGMDLGECLREGLRASELKVESSDVLAVTQKVVSKAEGRTVTLSNVEPSAQSIAISRRTGKDARLVETILRESKRIVRMRGDVLICETHHGFICANAGVDQSNVEEAETVTLLPRDPDKSARDLARVFGCGVIITDTFGRVWREGLVDVSIGIAGVPPFVDLRGTSDTFGRPLRATLLAAADSLAAAAGLVMGKTSKTPAALIRGFPWQPAETSVSLLLRPSQKDLFL